MATHVLIPMDELVGILLHFVALAAAFLVVVHPLSPFAEPWLGSVDADVFGWRFPPCVLRQFILKDELV